MAQDPNRRLSRQLDTIYTPGYRSLQPQPAPRTLPAIRTQYPAEKTPLELTYRTGAVLPRIGYEVPGGAYPGHVDGTPPMKPLVSRPDAAAATGPHHDIPYEMFQIPAIGQHRFLFSINKYPAFISLLLSCWILWGRGEAVNNWYERALGISGFVLGVWILLGWLLYALQNHHNVQRRAYEQAVVRIGHLLVTSFFTLIVIVFGILSIVDLQDLQTTETPPTPTTTTTTTMGPTDVYRDPTPPYTLDERVSISAVMLGMAIMILLFSLTSIVYGIYALTQLTKLERNIRRRLRAQQQAVYDNRGGSYY